MSLLNKLKSLSFTALLTIPAFLQPIQAASSTFQDVNPEAYYAQAAEEMNTLGIITGTSQGIFSPDSNLKRADLMVMLYRVSGTPQTSDFLPFIDTYDNQYYSSAIKWGYENGIITGKSAHLFGPGDTVSRQDLLLILYRTTAKRYGMIENRPDYSNYRDSEKIADYAQTAMDWAISRNILKGTEDGYLNPGQTTNRAQAAVILSRWLKLYPALYTSQKENHPENLAYTTRSLYTDDLQGILYEPAKTRAESIVVMCHALGTDLHSLNTHASYLARNGYAAYCFEFHGQGNAGNPLEMSVVSEMEDLKAVLENIRKLGYEKTYLYGESQGGIVAALEAEKTEGIDGLILIYPAFSIPDMVRSLFPSISYIPSVFNFVGNTLGYRYAADVINLDPYAQIGKSSFPVLIFHGQKDSIVPISYSQRANDQYPDSEIIIYPEEGHGFTPINVVDELVKIVPWLNNH